MIKEENSNILYTPSQDKDEKFLKNKTILKDDLNEVQEQNNKLAKSCDQSNTNKNIESSTTKLRIKKDLYQMKPEIIVKGNLRYIKPYDFQYQVWVKGRWVNRKLIDILNKEFTQYTEDYFKIAIENGKILINSKKVSLDYVIQNGDFLEHSIIREENPIINTKIDIIYDDDDYLVVDKPSSWPVHVCGGYQFNTLHRILLDEYGYKELKILHRLDKHTSGVVITAKNSEAAVKFRTRIENHTVAKSYYARVKGDFKWETINVIRAIVVENKAKGIHTDCDLDVNETDEKENVLKPNNTNLNLNVENKISNIISNNINHINKDLPSLESNTTVLDLNLKEENDNLNMQTKKKKDKLNRPRLDGVKTLDEINNEDENEGDPLKPKYAETLFEKVFYDKNSNTSVVKAHPKTGRTHQIRIHLRYLGFPIANDPCYGGVVFNDLEEFDNPDMFLKKTEPIKDEVELKDIISAKTLAVSEIFAYKIWLHAYRYQFEKYEFKTKTPIWANKDYVINKSF